MSSDPQPQVWSRFTKIRDGKELKMRIESLPDDMFEDMLTFWLKFFVPDEPIHKTFKISERPELLDEYLVILRILAMNVVYQVDACYLEENGEEEIVGMSVMVVEKKDKPFDDFNVVKSMFHSCSGFAAVLCWSGISRCLKSTFKSEELRNMLELLEYVDKQCNIYEKCNSESCYKGRGLAVDRDYRGLGIAGELLRARSTICKEQNIPMTSAWMTSPGVQKAADKLQWETVQEITYEDVKKQSKMEFEEGLSKLKLMISKTNTKY